MRIWRSINRYKAGNILIVFMVVQAACIIAGIFFPDEFSFLSYYNVQTMLKSIPLLAILSSGVGLLMISGEFDLSVGSNFALTAYIAALLFNMGLPVEVAFIASLTVGGFIGFTNGLIVLRANIPSFIATLGGMMFWRGILLIIAGGETEPFRPGGWFESAFSGSIGPIQSQFLWAIGVAVVAHLFLERHRIGNHMFAVGGNRQSAIAIGVNADVVKMIGFIVVGVLASLAGIISAVRVHCVSPDQGKGLELQAVAACVIGGLNLMGGEGSILGIFLGAALLFTIQDVLLLLRAPGFYLEMFMGIMIVLAVIFNELTKKKQGRE